LLTLTLFLPFFSSFIACQEAFLCFISFSQVRRNRKGWGEIYNACALNNAWLSTFVYFNQSFLSVRWLAL
jgi:hypothetical protein